MHPVLELLGWIFELTAEAAMEIAPEATVRAFVDLAAEDPPTHDTALVHERYLGGGAKYLSINDR